MILNPNKQIVNNIQKILNINGGYCPCKPQHIGEENYKCPCKEFRETDACCCGLYVSEK